MTTTTTTAIRPDDEQFAHVAFARRFPAAYVDWDADGVDSPLRLAVVDARPDAGADVGDDGRDTFVLLHGEPSWSALYEQWIPRLTAAGYRCVAIDLPGFGRSDKPVDDAWYTYERHCTAVAHVIDVLGLDDVLLVVQDWAGPIGLRQAVDRPERFRRLFIFNTWLHHDGFEYSEGIQWWRQAAADPGQLGGDMPTGAIVAGSMRRRHADGDAIRATFDAPFTTVESKAGARAFPAMIPLAPETLEAGGAAQQQRCYDALARWDACPVHIVFGDADEVFTFEWGERWASSIPGATLDRIVGAGHFVQRDAPDDCLVAIAGHLGHPI